MNETHTNVTYTSKYTENRILGTYLTNKTGYCDACRSESRRTNSEGYIEMHATYTPGRVSDSLFHCKELTYNTKRHSV